ncbi:alpha-ketoglutarate-dependent dioxygenase AlkB [Pseudoalteromonas sp. MMG013]|uniref:alpha-ketoglutarate-dependent dioxygenase AlkB family protein n=1 Tax=Pseudoalteromonas sp. MMG013 TaxID=2822687 RepID=UPI001B388397|nr:alpha-ketoglutarate-dependent dioxygenase AlkB [Pseudoalteromonas sp. MMG013]MBQ4861165.1 alpha-ketoglutarate-dependent dioxygenase AlkB [Pseudoalteromonas sp. MMG013]
MTLQNPEQLLPNGFDYIEQVMSHSKAMSLYTYLTEILNWQQPEVNIFGKHHKIPRLQCFIADKQVNYSYSNQPLVVENWPEPLKAMRRRLQVHYGYSFNALLVNWYRNGHDSMGWHSDDEKELGCQPFIVSISLGASRKFTIRNAHSKQTQNLMLDNGSCLLMHGQSQSHYQHALPKQMKVNSGRINLTFRTVGQ